MEISGGSRAITVAENALEADVVLSLAAARDAARCALPSTRMSERTWTLAAETETSMASALSSSHPRACLVLRRVEVAPSPATHIDMLILY